MGCGRDVLLHRHGQEPDRLPQRHLPSAQGGRSLGQLWAASVAVSAPSFSRSRLLAALQLISDRSPVRSALRTTTPTILPSNSVWTRSRLSARRLALRSESVLVRVRHPLCLTRPELTDYEPPPLYPSLPPSISRKRRPSRRATQGTLLACCDTSTRSVFVSLAPPMLATRRHCPR